MPVPTALRTAAVDVVRGNEAEARFHRMQQLITVSPALAAGVERGTARFDEVAGLIGARMGVDPAADPRPYLVASVVLCAVQPAVVAWRAAGQDEPESELIGRAFDLLTTGLDYRAASAVAGR
jgi:hypothetical protein